MADLSKQVVLSFSDLWQGIKKQKKLLTLSILIVGTFTFFYHLAQPIHFTAKGILKGKSSKGNFPNFIKVPDESFNNAEFYTSSDNPNIFLNSFPVMKGVVQHLNLQATVIEKKRKSAIKQLWQTFQAEQVQRRLKKQRLHSNVLAKNIQVPDRLFFPEAKTLLECTDVDYSGAIVRSLKISFIDDTHFHILENKQLVGEGEINRPFKQTWVSFTLRANEPLSDKVFRLNLIPLEVAVQSLQQMIRIKRDKENESLIHISYRHKKPHLAAAIVNSTMGSFQDYLQTEGKRKITKQLDYLQQRLAETLEQLEHVMEEQKHRLEGYLEEGEILSFDKELEFMSKNQAKNYEELNQLALEMQGIYSAIGNEKTQSFSMLLDQLQSTALPTSDKLQSLTIKSAKALIIENQHHLNRIQLEKQQYDYCLTKLEDSNFDCNSLSKILNDPTLVPTFEKIHNLHRNLIDEKNWTQKEQGQLKEKLGIEKQYLIRHIDHLKEGISVQENALYKQIHALQEALLVLLLDRYTVIERNVHDQLAKKSDHFSQKWMAEQKIEMNTKMSLEIMESVTKLIESKNIGYNLGYLNVTPLKSATVPIVPDPPKLYLSFILGCLGGFFLVLLGISFREMWLGPSLSYPNLHNNGYTVCGIFSSILKQRDLNTVRFLIHSLSQKGSLVLISSSAATTLPIAMSSLLSKREEKVLLIDLTSKKSPGLLNYLSQENERLIPSNQGSYDCFSLGEPEEFKEELLGTDRFKELLTTVKSQYNRILFISNTLPHSTEMALLVRLVDTTVFLANEERFSILEFLPSDTLFVLSPPKKLPLLHLVQIRPFIEKIRTNLTRPLDNLKKNGR